MNIEKELIDLYEKISSQFNNIKKILSGKDLEKAKDLERWQYSIFYSHPFYTLKEGPIYYLGLNPGADKTTDFGAENLNLFRGKEQDWCEFTDENWQSRDFVRIRIKNCLEKILNLMEIKKYEIKGIFCTNLYFFRTENEKILKKYADIFDCWEYHKKFLNMVRPKLIICNGNADKFSAFSSIYRNFKNNIDADGEKPNNYGIYGKYSLKWFFLKDSPWQHGKVLVLGIPHLSRFSPNEVIYSKIQQLISRLNK